MPLIHADAATYRYAIDADDYFRQRHFVIMLRLFMIFSFAAERYAIFIFAPRCHRR